MSSTPKESSALSTSESLLEVGQVIDSRYRVTGVLGAGGMGCVYRAEHLILKRAVAIKLLHAKFSDSPEVAQRFEREAFATGQVVHPNCVVVSDGGRLETGAFYIVLELLDGISLSELLAQKKELSVERSLHICRHVLRALEHAHKSGIIHRDIKPDNIIITSFESDQNFAKILDFGIAKLMEPSDETPGGQKLTQVGLAMGTPAYMSPEQAFGQEVDGRTDIYCLSVMLFEMIAGRPPFEADDVLSLLKHHAATEAPSLIETAKQAVPEAVEILVRKGLEKLPDDRIASAKEYGQAIDTILSEMQASTPGVEGTPPSENFAPLAPSPDGALLEHSLEQAYFTGAQAHIGQEPAGTQAPMTGAAPLLSSHTPAQAYSTSAIGHTLPPATGMQSLDEKPGLWQRFLALPMGLRVVSGTVAAVFVIALMAIAFRGDSKPARTNYLPENAKNSPEPNDELKEAAELLSQGQPDKVIEKLGKIRKQAKPNPAALLVLGHAFSSSQKFGDAATVYTQALSHDSSLANNDILQANLDVFLQRTSKKKDGPDMRAAIPLLRALIKAEQAKAQKQLLDLASSAKHSATRKQARETATEVDLGEKVDWLASYTMDLKGGKNCNERRKAVASLRALGNPAAIPILKESQRRVRKGGVLGLRKQNTNACLQSDATAAIAYLENL